ncbi:hypothetical protein LCGC14_0316850 [marine sediment metagenome]|uniref:ClpX-type ZB domain-containing protein n=1 Tax=marine sediment metagenome TaxID=412755 RepID=A0A0F9WSK6_9ZZZZ
MKNDAMEKSPCPRCRRFTYLYESPGMGIRKHCLECFHKELKEQGVNNA